MHRQHQKPFVAFSNQFLCLLSIAAFAVVGWLGGCSSAQEVSPATATATATALFLNGPAVLAPVKMDGQWVEIRLAHTLVDDTRVSYLIRGAGNDQQIIRIIAGSPFTSSRTWAMAIDEDGKAGVVCAYFQRPDSCDVRLIEFAVDQNRYRGADPEGFIRDLLQKGTPDQIGRRMLTLEAELKENELATTNFKIKDRDGKLIPLIALSATELSLASQQNRVIVTVSYSFLRGQKTRTYRVAYDRSEKKWIRTETFEPS